MKVSIVIPVWNGESLLKIHLPKVIKAKKYFANKVIEIIIVDDASTDNSVKYLQKEFKNDISLIKHTQNRGFASAVNLGFKMAKGDLVCLLNQDVSPSENFLEAVIPHFNDQKIFAVTLHEKNHGPATAVFRGGYIEHRGAPESDKTKISFWANGGSAVFSRKVWLKLKGFDEDLFKPFYWEDMDISYRAQKHGYKILWEPKAHVLHEHESVINTNYFRKRKLNLIKERNQLLLIWKNITSKRLIKKHVVAMFKRGFRHPGYFIVIAAAFSKFKIVIKKRKQETKESIISDEAIFSKFE